MVKVSIALLLFCCTPAYSVQAAEPITWNLDNAASSIRWQAVQNHAPVEGGFALFSASISFHPDALAQSHVRVTIPTNSIVTSYAEAQDTLQTAEWFAAQSFPEAIFEAKAFEALGENRYRANGTLSLKGKTLPVLLNFDMLHFSETQAHMKGEATLKRTDFAIGWSDTASIEDAVKVMVEIKATR